MGKNKLKIGDVIKLKNSDILMTVEKIEKSKIYTVWFENDMIKRNSYSLNTITFI